MHRSVVQGAVRGAAHRAQRGSQSLEWIALGSLVAAALTAAARLASTDGSIASAVAHGILGSFEGMTGGGGR